MYLLQLPELITSYCRLNNILTAFTTKDCFCLKMLLYATVFLQPVV